MNPFPLVALLLLGPAAGGASGDAGDGRSSPAAFAVSTERVQVDLVVRDKNDVMLRGLATGDLEVYEDGVRQEIESLDFVERKEMREAAAPAAAAPPAFVAIAFDRLGLPARHLARQAVLAHLDRPSATRAWMGLFSIDRGLSTVQAFTDDRDALRRALARTASAAPASFAGLRERNLVRNAYGGLAAGGGQAHVAPAELSGVPECRSSQDEVVRRLELLESRLVEAFTSMERDQQGFATTHALLALIGALEPLPGRKAILLFSEGLAIPADVETSFVSVVAAANRANVSIYGVDAGGLRAASAADDTRRTIDSLQTRLQLQNDGTGNPLTRGAAANDPGTSGLALLERNEDTLRLAPGSGLGRLAEQTGGFLIQDTNDFAAGLAQMNEELGAHYVLSYAPKNKVYDGRFRTIAVKLRRPHGRLQARKGYLALTTSLPVPALDYEAPALARLESTALPTAVPVRLRGLQFPEEPPLSLVPILVEVPARGLHELTIVVLVRDAARQVVAKMSQRYGLSGAGAPASAAGPVLFYREARLPPGSYTLEAVAYDARSGSAGGARSALEVPSADADHLRASSLMVVGSAEKLGPEAGARPKPLQYGDVLLYPNLGQPLPREAGRPLTFFVTAWPALERPAVDARLEVVHDGRRVAATRATNLRPGADGRIQLASSLALERLAPGAYELRLTLSDGRDEETRVASVPVAP